MSSDKRVAVTGHPAVPVAAPVEPLQPVSAAIPSEGHAPAGKPETDPTDALKRKLSHVESQVVILRDRVTQTRARAEEFRLMVLQLREEKKVLQGTLKETHARALHEIFPRLIA